MKVYNTVKYLLEKEPHLRDSDKELLLSFWELQGMGFSDRQKQLFLDKCTPSESITRARRQLRGLYPGTPKVEQERYSKFLQYKNENAAAQL